MKRCPVPGFRGYCLNITNAVFVKLTVTNLLKQRDTILYILIGFAAPDLKTNKGFVS